MPYSPVASSLVRTPSPSVSFFANVGHPKCPPWADPWRCCACGWPGTRPSDRMTTLRPPSSSAVSATVPLAPLLFCSINVARTVVSAAALVGSHSRAEAAAVRRNPLRTLLIYPPESRADVETPAPVPHSPVLPHVYHADPGQTLVSNMNRPTQRHLVPACRGMVDTGSAGFRSRSGSVSDGFGTMSRQTAPADGVSKGCCTAAVTPGTSTARPTARLGRGLLLVCLAGVIWGTIGPGVRLVHEGSGLSPLTISAYRAIAAVAVLLLAAAFTRRLATSWSLARYQWRRVIIVGLLTAAFQLLFFIAVVATGVSIATVVCLGFAPVLLLVISCSRQRRPPSLSQALTVVTAVTGLLLVCLAGGAVEVAPDPVIGILAALGSGAAFGLATDIARPLSQRLDALTVTIATMTVAATVLVPGGLLLAYLRGEALTTSDAGSWLLIGYLGVVTMVVAYALFYTGLRSTPSGAAVVATLVEPVAAVLIAVLFLGEHLTVAGVVGCLLILAAIASSGRQTDDLQPQ